MHGDEISFVFHGNIEQIYDGRIPQLFNESYNVADLKNYVSGPDVNFIDNNELKDELKRMLEESFRILKLKIF